MTSREQIFASINHREPDKVPVDLGATPSSGISAIAYNNLKKQIGIDSEPTRVYDVIQQLAQPEDAVHNIIPDVPPENVVAMFDAVREFNGERKE